VNRRQTIGALGALGLLVGSGVRAQTRPLRIVIPANVGGGWDETGRSLGAALLASNAASDVQYENRGGKGGIVGLTHFVANHTNDQNALMIGGMVMTGSLAVNRPPVDLDRVTPIARLTGEYDVIVVAPNSRFRTLGDLLNAMKTNIAEIRFTGGSIGGVDHFVLGKIARKQRLNASQLNYTPRPDGKTGLDALLAGQADVLVKSYSECREAIEKKSVRALAISSAKPLYGIPPLRAAGVFVEISNWRGVFAAGEISAERAAALQDLVKQAIAHPVWLGAMKQRNWVASPLYGEEFKRFIALEQSVAHVMAHMLKLKPT
jgi:putative tricarboxylic transport membrane protein